MISGFTQITPTDARKTSTTKNGVLLGTSAVTRDGKVYRWSKAGGVALAAGKLTVNSDVDANVINKTVAATVAAGSLQVVVDAAGAIAADAYADGYLTVSDATGEGISYLIVGNTSTSGAGEMTVTLAEPLVVGLTVDVSEVSLLKNVNDGVVISATDQADLAVGVPNVSVAASSYFWNQVSGDCSVLADEAVTKGVVLTIGTGVAGAVEAIDLIGEQAVGVAKEALVDTEYRAAHLTIG